MPLGPGKYDPAGFIIETDEKSRLAIGLNGEHICDFHDDGFHHSIVIEIVDRIAELLAIPVTKVGDPPDAGDDYAARTMTKHEKIVTWVEDVRDDLRRLLNELPAKTLEVDEDC